MIYLATTLTSLTATGLFSWWTSFMLRVHRLDLTTVGVISTVALGLFAIGGNIATGHVSDLARRRSAGGSLMVVCGTTLISLVFAAMAIWSPSTPGMVIALCLAGATLGAYIVPRSAAISELAPPQLQGMAFTIPVVIANLIGVSLGPVTVGAISDASANALPGVEPLRVAMSSVLMLQLPAALIYFLAARGLDRRAALRPLAPQPAA
jgi:MFS family permease